MSVCPNCQETNSDNSRFCQFCGMPLPKKQVEALSTAIPLTQSTSIPHQKASTQQLDHNIGQLGDGGTAGGSLWGPFAGFGTRGRHSSWLLDNLGEKAGALHEAVTQRFQQRQIPNTNMKWYALVAQGVLVERRPFYFVRRGITTVALYIAQFGNDLYISQVTYAKGPISNVRIGILALMALFQLFFMFQFTNTVVGQMESYVSSFNPFGGGSSGSTSLLAIMLCCVGPLGLLNTLAWLFILAFSGFKYLTEKDLPAILRRPPNEFQIDDTIALEKAVEETVRQSLDAIGIDASLMIPVQDPDAGRTIRLI